MLVPEMVLPEYSIPQSAPSDADSGALVSLRSEDKQRELLEWYYKDNFVPAAKIVETATAQINSAAQQLYAAASAEIRRPGGKVQVA